MRLARFIQFIPIVERVTRDAPVPSSADSPRPPPGAIAPISWTTRRDRPLYRQAGDLVTERSIRPDKFGAFLNGVFDEWVRYDVGTVYVQMFDAALANWVGAPPGMCVHSRHCGTALALEHNGDLYSCDHFVEPAHKLGNFLTHRSIDLVASPQQATFGRDKFDSLPAYCRACDVRFACHGGCPKDRFTKTPHGEGGLNYLCAGFKTFFAHVSEPMSVMARLLHQNRAPSEIMRRSTLLDADAATAADA